jgi:hypothetical protein
VSRELGEKRSYQRVTNAQKRQGKGDREQGTVSVSRETSLKG